ncbi:hypothetical protein Barb4_01149 [Bacteroidales bacterium Barb4]|nr:hypothetical protein Barb4_01149 [Bacteroidales bacterium Barb4]
MNSKSAALLFLLFFTLPLCAQNGDEVFSFLRYPSSARANALGGNTVALIERDPSLALHNPGLLGGESDGMVNLNYMSYISDIKVGSALYTKAHKERGAWGIGASFIDYGSFKEALPENIVTGSFSAQDINVQALYAYDLSERWRGGLSLKFLYSTFAEFTSTGVGADAGVSYYNEEKAFSFGFALKNVGVQLKAYENRRQNLPWDIQAGFTKKMEHAPIRLSVTAAYLNRWKFDYTDNMQLEHEDSFMQTLVKHFTVGADIVPSDNFWMGIGFNAKRNADMKLQGGNSFGGFSAGAGIRIRMFDVGVSVAQYHPSALSMMLSLSTTLSGFRP